MQTVTIGTKNQIVIPLSIRKQIKGFRPGYKVRVYSIDNETVAVKVEKKSWVERTRGIMKNAWENIDPIKELEKSRKEWDERIKRLEKTARSK